MREMHSKRKAAPTPAGAAFACLLRISPQWGGGGHGAGKKRAQHTFRGAGRRWRRRRGWSVCEHWTESLWREIRLGLRRTRGPAQPDHRDARQQRPADDPLREMGGVHVVVSFWSGSLSGVGRVADDTRVAAHRLRGLRAIHANSCARSMGSRGIRATPPGQVLNSWVIFVKSCHTP